MLKPFATALVVLTLANNVAQAQTASDSIPEALSAPQLAAPEAPSFTTPSLSAPSTSAETRLPIPQPAEGIAVSAQARETDPAPVENVEEAAANSDAVAPVNAEEAAVADVEEVAQVELAGFADRAQQAYDKAFKFLQDGGPSIWAIAALAVITLALILWKIWRLALMGAWSRGKAGKALNAYERGDYALALKTVQSRRGVRSKVLTAGLIAIDTLPEARAREEVTRIAKGQIATARTGLGALELISTIAPLLGLLGTVLGMIAAFQALQAAGSKADPALLAGGIWEALLTTAAGMAVAIPASAALTWFESVIDRIRRDIEDGATRLFVAIEPQEITRLAAE